MRRFRQLNPRSIAPLPSCRLSATVRLRLCGPTDRTAGAAAAAWKFTVAEAVKLAPFSAVPVIVKVLVDGATVLWSQQRFARRTP